MEGVDLYGGMSAQDEEMMADTGFSGSQIKQIAVLEEDVDQRFAPPFLFCCTTYSPVLTIAHAHTAHTHTSHAP
jgi:hypothetical protein